MEVTKRVTSCLVYRFRHDAGDGDVLKKGHTIILLEMPICEVLHFCPQVYLVDILGNTLLLDLSASASLAVIPVNPYLFEEDLIQSTPAKIK